MTRFPSPAPPPVQTTPPERHGFTRRVAVAVIAASAAAALLVGLWQAREIVLLAFAGVLAAVLLRGPADWLRQNSPLSDRWAVVLVLTTVTGLIAGALMWRGPAVAEQFDALRETLPQAIDRATQRLEQYEWGRTFVAGVQPLVDRIAEPSDLIGRATSFAWATLAVVAKFFIVLFTALYLVFEPRWYASGVVRLVAPAHRDRARRLLTELEHSLRRWLYIRMGSMVLVGLLVWLGLELLDIPLAFTLALLAALLDFVPNFGPLVAAIPGILLAFLDGPLTAVYVAGLYLGVQIIESYGFTPLLQRRALALAPALVLSVQALLGVLVGVIGVALAAPVTLVGFILVKRLYVEGRLEAHSDTIVTPVDTSAGSEDPAPRAAARRSDAEPSDAPAFPV